MLRVGTEATNSKATGPVTWAMNASQVTRSSFLNPDGRYNGYDIKVAQWHRHTLPSAIVVRLRHSSGDPRTYAGDKHVQALLLWEVALLNVRPPSRASLPREPESMRNGVVSRITVGLFGKKATSTHWQHQSWSRQEPRVDLCSLLFPGSKWSSPVDCPHAVILTVGNI